VRPNPFGSESRSGTIRDPRRRRGRRFRADSRLFRISTRMSFCSESATTS